MEPVIAFVVFVSLAIWADDSKEEPLAEQNVTPVIVIDEEKDSEVEESIIPAEDLYATSANHLGYKIKDLSIKVETPEGCHRPVLTSDLSASSGVDGVRKVNEVKVSCEG